MKKNIYILFLLISIITYSQVQPSPLIDGYFTICKSDPPSSPRVSQVYYDCEDLKYYQWTGTEWIGLEGIEFIDGNGTTFNTNKYDLGGDISSDVVFNVSNNSSFVLTGESNYIFSPGSFSATTSNINLNATSGPTTIQGISTTLLGNNDFIINAPTSFRLNTPDVINTIAQDDYVLTLTDATNGVADFKPIISSSGLEAIDEGNGYGWRLINRDANNYGNIGLDAIDLSTSTVTSSVLGATGLRSFATSWNNEASGMNSASVGGAGGRALADRSGTFAGSTLIALAARSVAVGGQTNTASGVESGVYSGNNNASSGADAIVIGGNTNSASGNQSGVYSGLDNNANSNLSVILGGRGNTTFNLSETLVGYYSTTSSLGSQTTHEDANRVFNVGIGLFDGVPVERKDGLSVFHDGRVLAPELDISEIDLDPKSLTTNEWVQNEIDNSTLLYETGTFSGNFADSGGGVTYSSTCDCTYSRIGNQVTINIRISGVTSSGTPSGQLRLINLPYSAASTSSAYVSTFALGANAPDFYVVSAQISSDNIIFYYKNAFNNVLGSPVMPAFEVASSGTTTITTTYITNE
ncbi:hypothetical protein [Abyssalbus ytuae]|uniref:Trimeric autotransporter adhesin YadA-like head domain-containing protein n=1 Tax=Abyssalbus ytuae TaxID=2926907 RepID=A0A9E7D2E3_9FLAO|nr:hypothetical protein [Abyssalbus ytuae]UOB16599.1 hypothetical protein MQE35_12740 [Abyssalbus ytuae]